MTYDFNCVVDRRGTDSLKWAKYAGRDVLPMWVADMDFEAPPTVLEGIRRRLEQGVLGYALPPREALDAVVMALERDHGWLIDPAWLCWMPGLVTALNVCCRMLAPGESVATFVPVYPPFLSAPANFSRELTRLPLVEAGARFELPLDLLDQALPAPARMLMLCNPHNPTGRVFSRGELERLAEICLRRDMVLCSDEIHCDLVLDRDKRHLPIATLSPEVAARTITLMAPSKTYNIPGLGCAFAIIPNPELRQRFRKAADGIVPHVNVLGYAACTAAYRDGADWRAALLAHLRANRDRVEAAAGGWKGIRVRHVEATYLAWLDCREAALGEEPYAFFLKAGVGLSDGAEFGQPGCVRLNFGCPTATLVEGLRRIEKAVTVVR
jgi:cysteine-S-conjugate beta-lyase